MSKVRLRLVGSGEREMWGQFRGGPKLTDWICRTAMQIDLWNSPNLNIPRTQTQAYGRWALGIWKCELGLDSAPNTTNWIYQNPMQIDLQNSPKLKIPPNSNATFQLFSSGSSTCDLLGLDTDTNPTNAKRFVSSGEDFCAWDPHCDPNWFWVWFCDGRSRGASEVVRARGRWEEGKSRRAGPGRGEKV